jgi:alkylation response protein AidB-like acyl-CoA dehydrogenase
MDFAPSEEQEMLKKSARDFLSVECPKKVVREIEAGDLGYSPELWKKMASLGWMGLALPEEYGGAGLSLLDMAVLFEEFGRAAMTEPMFSTVVLGALPILKWGTEEQKKAFLPKVATGELFLTMALAEPGVNEDPMFVTTRAMTKDDGFLIHGTKLFVPYAHIADYLLVVARTKGVAGDKKGITVFIVDRKSQGINITPLVTVAADKQFEVQFDKVFVSSKNILGSLHNGLPLVREMLKKATAIQCAEMVGMAQQEMEITAEHTKNRVQFERPIGTFQAVQHRLADMFIDVNGVRWTTYQAVWRLSEGLPADREVAIAKAFANIACQRVAFSAQQLHGGLGVDKDYDLHFYFRRAKAFALTLGSTPFHLKTLEAEISQ